MAAVVTHMGALMFGMGMGALWSKNESDAVFVTALGGAFAFAIGSFVQIVTKGAVP